MTTSIWRHDDGTFELTIDDVSHTMTLHDLLSLNATMAAAILAQVRKLEQEATT